MQVDDALWLFLGKYTFYTSAIFGQSGETTAINDLWLRCHLSIIKLEIKTAKYTGSITKSDFLL